MAPPAGLPFLGCESLATGQLVGSLREPGGGLRASGVLRSRVATRPLRLREGQDKWREGGSSDPPRAHGAAREAPLESEPYPGAWSSHKEYLAALQGKAVPKRLQGRLAQSILSHSLSPQSTSAQVLV